MTDRPAGERQSAVRANTARFRALWRARTRDRRFALIGFSLPRIAASLVALAAALAFLVLAADPWHDTIDHFWPEPAEQVFEFFNWLGEGILVYVFCVVLLVASLVRDLSARPLRQRAYDLTRAAAASYVLVAVVAAGLTAKLLKFVIGRARPRLDDQVGGFAFDMFAPGSSWESFPSGHTTTVMSCAMALALLMPRWRVPILIAGLAVAFARIATGAHYPSDVLGGCALGMFVSWVFARALARRRLVFRFDGEGRLRPLHYLGRAFSTFSRGRTA